MSSVQLAANASGSGVFAIASPNSNNSRTATLPDATGEVVVDAATQTLTNKTLGSGLVMSASTLTASGVQNASGAGVTFSSIPSWVKRITVVFNGISLSGTANPLIQIGDSGGFENTGYFSLASGITTAGTATANSSGAGFLLAVSAAATDTFQGLVQLVNVSGNVWAISGDTARDSTTDAAFSASGSKTLSDTLDRLYFTNSGADTFDAGTVNVYYE